MEKIMEVPKRIPSKNILNYSMNKSEKCYYAIIENKKRGKFSGASPIQVAKKVASKKLKSGKEIEFYLDEVGSKKKRYGPYYGRKDKKTGKVAVVKGRKVMKGGVLSTSDREELKEIFNNFNNNGSGIAYNGSNPNFVIKSRLPFISFGKEPIVYFYPNGSQRFIYKFAVFKERTGNIYIMIYKSDRDIDIVSMTDFFLNPYYSINFNPVKNGRFGLNKQNILSFLQNHPRIIESRTIREEARKIYELLYLPTSNKLTQKVIIYVPNYYQPLIRKCVYPDLTFGILDEQPRTITSEFPRPESNYQKFLILKQTGLSGMSVNEPVIYIRVLVIGKNQRGGLLTVEQINNYLEEIDGLIQKIKIRNTPMDSRSVLSRSMNNIKLPTVSGIKKIDDDISLLEYYIIGNVLPNPQRIISKEDKELQIIRLNKLKIILLEKKLQLQQIQPQQQFRRNEQTQQLLQIKQLETQLKNQQKKLQLQQIQPQQEFRLKEETQQLETQLKNQQQQFRRNEQTQQLLQIKQLETQLKNQLPHFDYCIYTNPTNRKELMIKRSDGSQPSYFHKRLDNIKNICKILLGIPEIFGRLERVRIIANDIIFPQKNLLVPESIKSMKFQTNI